MPDLDIQIKNNLKEAGFLTVTPDGFVSWGGFPDKSGFTVSLLRGITKPPDSAIRRSGLMVEPYSPFITASTSHPM